MKDILERHLREKVQSPSDKEIEEILGLFEPKQFNKNDFIKRPYTISRNFFYLIEGSVRSVFLKENGEEITYKIHEVNSFITDLLSYRSDEITPIGFRCIKKTDLLVASQDAVHQLLKTNLALNIAYREVLTKKLVEVGNSYMKFLTGNSKERYDFILKNYPDYFKNLPLKYIASLIGVTPTQLSRLRNENSKKA
ncbi:MAG: Crp/Fnr family transcriptional regulator [Leptolyngbya sp. SIO3F4]|nr:Crp/Fnr family transcriptional regulator [Leptolyngbya sp. SIO3F4]